MCSFKKSAPIKIPLKERNNIKAPNNARVIQSTYRANSGPVYAIKILAGKNRTPASMANRIIVKSYKLVSLFTKKTAPTIFKTKCFSDFYEVRITLAQISKTEFFRMK